MPVRKPTARRNLEQREKALEQRKLQEKLKRLSPSERRKFLRKLILLKKKSSSLQKKVVTSKPQFVKKDSAQRKEEVARKKKIESEKLKNIAERKRSELIRKQTEAQKRMELRKKIAERKRIIVEKQKRELMIKKIEIEKLKERRKEIERQKLIVEKRRLQKQIEDKKRMELRKRIAERKKRIAERKVSGKRIETKVIGKPINRRTVIKEVDFTPETPFRRESLRQVVGMGTSRNNANLERNSEDRDKERKIVPKLEIKSEDKKQVVKEKTQKQIKEESKRNPKIFAIRKKVEGKIRWNQKGTFDSDFDALLDNIGWQYEEQILRILSYNNPVSAYAYHTLRQSLGKMKKWIPGLLDLCENLTQKEIYSNDSFRALEENQKIIGKWMPQILEMSKSLAKKEVESGNIIEIIANLIEKNKKNKFMEKNLEKIIDKVKEFSLEMERNNIDTKNYSPFFELKNIKTNLSKWTIIPILDKGIELIKKGIYPSKLFTILRYNPWALSKHGLNFLDKATTVVIESNGNFDSGRFYDYRGHNVLKNNIMYILDKIIEIQRETENKEGANPFLEALKESPSLVEKFGSNYIDELSDFWKEMSKKTRRRDINPRPFVRFIINNVGLMEKRGLGVFLLFERYIEELEKYNFDSNYILGCFSRAPEINTKYGFIFINKISQILKTYSKTQYQLRRHVEIADIINSIFDNKEAINHYGINIIDKIYDTYMESGKSENKSPSNLSGIFSRLKDIINIYGVDIIDKIKRYKINRAKYKEDSSRETIFGGHSDEYNPLILKNSFPALLDLANTLMEKNYTPYSFNRLLEANLQNKDYFKKLDKKNKLTPVLNVIGEILEVKNEKNDFAWWNFEGLGTNIDKIEKWFPEILPIARKTESIDAKRDYMGMMGDNYINLRKYGTDFIKTIENATANLGKEDKENFYQAIRTNAKLINKNGLETITAFANLGIELIKLGENPYMAFKALESNNKALEKHGMIIVDKLLELGKEFNKKGIELGHPYWAISNNSKTLEEFGIKFIKRSKDMGIELKERGIDPENAFWCMVCNSEAIDKHGFEIIDKLQSIGIELKENGVNPENAFYSLRVARDLFENRKFKIIDKFVKMGIKLKEKGIAPYKILYDFKFEGEKFKRWEKYIFKEADILIEKGIDPERFFESIEHLPLGLTNRLPYILKLGVKMDEKGLDYTFMFRSLGQNMLALGKYGNIISDKFFEFAVKMSEKGLNSEFAFNALEENRKTLENYGSIIIDKFFELAVKIDEKGLNSESTFNALERNKQLLIKFGPEILDFAIKISGGRLNHILLVLSKNIRLLEKERLRKEILDFAIKINGEGFEYILPELGKNEKLLKNKKERKKIFSLFEKSVKKRIAPNALFALIHKEGLERAKDFLERGKARDDLERDILFYSKHKMHTYENYSLSFEDFLEKKREYEKKEIPEPFVSGEKVIKLKQTKFDVNLSRGERTVLRNIVRGLSDNRSLRELVIQGIEDKSSNRGLSVLGEKFKGKKEELLKQVSEMSDKELVSRIKRLFKNKPKREELIALLPVYKEIAILKNPQLEWIRNVKLEETMVSLNQISEAINEATGKGIKEVDGLKNIRIVKSRGKESIEVKLVPSKEVEDVFFGYFGPCCVNNQHSAILDKNFTPIRMLVGNEIVGTVFLFKSSSNGYPVYVLAGIEPRAVLYNKVSPDALVKGVISKVNEYAEEEGAIVAQHPHNAAFSNVDSVKNSIKKVCGREIKLDSYVGFRVYKTRDVLIV